MEEPKEAVGESAIPGHLFSTCTQPYLFNKFPFTVAIIYGVLLGERPAKKRVFPGALLYPQEL